MENELPSSTGGQLTQQYTGGQSHRDPISGENKEEITEKQEVVGEEADRAEESVPRGAGDMQTVVDRAKRCLYRLIRESDSNAVLSVGGLNVVYYRLFGVTFVDDFRSVKPDDHFSFLQNYADFEFKMQKNENRMWVFNLTEEDKIVLAQEALTQESHGEVPSPSKEDSLEKRKPLDHDAVAVKPRRQAEKIRLEVFFDRIVECLKSLGGRAPKPEFVRCYNQKYWPNRFFSDSKKFGPGNTWMTKSGGKIEFEKLGGCYIWRLPAERPSETAATMMGGGPVEQEVVDVQPGEKITLEIFTSRIAECLKRLGGRAHQEEIRRCYKEIYSTDLFADRNSILPEKRSWIRHTEGKYTFVKAERGWILELMARTAQKRPHSTSEDICPGDEKKHRPCQ